MPARWRAASHCLTIALALLLAAGGCAGGRAKSGVLTQGGDGGAWRPRKLALLYPQLAPDSMPARDAGSGARPFMGGEINAVVHVALRARLEALAKPEVR